MLDLHAQKVMKLTQILHREFLLKSLDNPLKESY